jgi:hypothetical protein
MNDRIFRTAYHPSCASPRRGVDDAGLRGWRFPFIKAVLLSGSGEGIGGGRLRGARGMGARIGGFCPSCDHTLARMLPFLWYAW